MKLMLINQHRVKRDKDFYQQICWNKTLLLTFDLPVAFMTNDRTWTVFFKLEPLCHLTPVSASVQHML